jgi:hypothetical protein
MDATRWVELTYDSYHWFAAHPWEKATSLPHEFMILRGPSFTSVELGYLRDVSDVTFRVTQESILNRILTFAPTPLLPPHRPPQPPWTSPNHSTHNVPPSRSTSDDFHFSKSTEINCNASIFVQFLTFGVSVLEKASLLITDTSSCRIFSSYTSFSFETLISDTSLSHCSTFATLCSSAQTTFVCFGRVFQWSVGNQCFERK